MLQGSDSGLTPSFNDHINTLRAGAKGGNGTEISDVLNYVEWNVRSFRPTDNSHAEKLKIIRSALDLTREDGIESDYRKEVVRRALRWIDEARDLPPEFSIGEEDYGSLRDSIDRGWEDFAKTGELRKKKYKIIELESGERSIPGAIFHKVYPRTVFSGSDYYDYMNRSHLSAPTIVRNFQQVSAGSAGYVAVNFRDVMDELTGNLPSISQIEGGRRKDPGFSIVDRMAAFRNGPRAIMALNAMETSKYSAKAVIRSIDAIKDDPTIGPLLTHVEEWLPDAASKRVEFFSRIDDESMGGVGLQLREAMQSKKGKLLFEDLRKSMLTWEKSVARAKDLAGSNGYNMSSLQQALFSQADVIATAAQDLPIINAKGPNTSLLERIQKVMPEAFGKSDSGYKM
jgi:hypothetical protein